MAGLRDPQRYRDEAALFLRLAEDCADEAGLRDSYLALAVAYERVADALDRADWEPGREPSFESTKATKRR
jgi:hypothetical protein